MALRIRRSWLPCLALLALLVLPAVPSQPAASLADLQIVDPTQQALMNDLFLEARGAHPSFARGLLPGRGDQHLTWFPEQFLVPLANSATPGAPLPGFSIGANGALQATPTTLGAAQGTGTAGAALSPSGNACYLAEGTTNDI